MLIFALIIRCGITHGQDALLPVTNATFADAATNAAQVEAATNTVQAKAVTNNANSAVQSAENKQLAEVPALVVSTNAENPIVMSPEKPTTPVERDSLESTNSNPSDPVEITLQPDVTLPNAIQLLARIAKINFQFDPQLLNEKAEDKITPIPVPVIGVEIRWKGVTAAQALNALLDNYNWQMISDPKTGISRVTRKNPAALEPMITKVIHLKYGNATNLIIQLTNLVNRISPRSMIVPDMRTSQMVLMATEREMAVLETLIEKLDTATKQVLIEARLLETTRNPQSVKGIDWSGTLSAQKFSFGNGKSSTAGTVTDTRESKDANTITGNGKVLGGATANTDTKTATMTTTTTMTPSSSGFSADTLRGFNPATAFLNADGVQAVLSFLNSDTESEQVNLPRTVAQDGVATELAVIQNIPIFEQEQSAGAVGSQALATAKPNYEKTVGGTIINEVGVKLVVTPRIVGATNVSLNLRPEVSDQDAIEAKSTIGGQVNTSPIFNRRKIITEATVPSGFTLVLGGLNQNFTTKIYTKVPLLGDIPGIGLLFRHESKSRTKKNLMIFITPTIIEDSDFQSTKTEFLKSRFVDKPDVPESAWNSAKPKDWTKPKPQVEPTY